MMILATFDLQEIENSNDSMHQDTEDMKHSEIIFYQVKKEPKG